MYNFEILCLANSRKLHGRCVAGLTREGEWIRPVSADDDGTLYARHYLLDTGDEAAVLDLVRVHVDQHVPEPHQPENWRVANVQWQRLRQMTGDDARHFLHRHTEPGPELLGNRLDRVSWEYLTAAPASASLALVEPRELRWYIRTSYSGNRQARALFNLAGQYYDLSITDPTWEARLGGLAYGVHPLEAGGLTGQEEIFLTISLSEPLIGYCFKLIASVVVIP
jgi:hypothetical protein